MRNIYISSIVFLVIFFSKQVLMHKQSFIFSAHLQIRLYFHRFPFDILLDITLSVPLNRHISFVWKTRSIFQRYVFSLNLVPGHNIAESMFALLLLEGICHPVSLTLPSEHIVSLIFVHVIFISHHLIKLLMKINYRACFIILRLRLQFSLINRLYFWVELARERSLALLHVWVTNRVVVEFAQELLGLLLQYRQFIIIFGSPNQLFHDPLDHGLLMFNYIYWFILHLDVILLCLVKCLYCFWSCWCFWNIKSVVDIQRTVLWWISYSFIMFWFWRISWLFVVWVLDWRGLIQNWQLQLILP